MRCSAQPAGVELPQKIEVYFRVPTGYDGVVVSLWNANITGGSGDEIYSNPNTILFRLQSR